MSFSAQVKAELQAELERLEERAKAIRSILGIRDEKLTFVLDSDSGSGPYAGMTVREAVQTVFSARNRAWRPGELADYLERNGFNAPGVTKLSVLVANEFSRLKKGGALVYSGGRYAKPKSREEDE